MFFSLKVTITKVVKNKKGRVLLWGIDKFYNTNNAAMQVSSLVLPLIELTALKQTWLIYNCFFY